MKKSRSRVESQVLRNAKLADSLTVITVTRGRKKPKVPRIRPRAHRHNDLYCLYYWWRTEIDGPKLPKQVPLGYTIAGDEICIWCRNPQFHECEKTLIVSPVPGITWHLILEDITSCTHCIEGRQFEIVPGSG